MEPRLLLVWSDVKKDVHDPRPHKGLYVVQRGLEGGERRAGSYAINDADHTEARMLQHGELKDCVAPTRHITIRSRPPQESSPIPEDAKWKSSGA